MKACLTKAREVTRHSEQKELGIAMLMGDCREVATAELCFYDWFYSVLKKTFL